jgi:hypothetical protein
MNITKALFVSSVVSQGLPKTEIEKPKLDRPEKTITTPIPNPATIPEISSYKNENPASPKVHYVKISRDGLSKENSLLSLGLNGFLFVLLSGASLKIVALKSANNRISKHINYLKKEIEFHERIVGDILRFNSNDDINLLKQDIARNLLLKNSTQELTNTLGRPSIV